MSNEGFRIKFEFVFVSLERGKKRERLYFLREKRNFKIRKIMIYSCVLKSEMNENVYTKMNSSTDKTIILVLHWKCDVYEGAYIAPRNRGDIKVGPLFYFCFGYNNVIQTMVR